MLGLSLIGLSLMSRAGKFASATQAQRQQANQNCEVTNDACLGLAPTPEACTAVEAKELAIRSLPTVAPLISLDYIKPKPLMMNQLT